MHPDAQPGHPEARQADAGRKPGDRTRVNRRVLALLLICLVGGAGLGAAQAVGADAAGQAPPTQLWEQFPLDNSAATTPASPTVTAQSPAATPVSPSTTTAAATSSGSVNSVDLLVWVLVALIALPIVALTIRGVVRRRHGAAEREPRRSFRPSVAG